MTAEEDIFIETPEGRAFFPYWPLARGYLVAEADEGPLRRFRKRFVRVQWMGLVALLVVMLPVERSWRFVEFVVAVALPQVGLSVAYGLRCRAMERARESFPMRRTAQRSADKLLPAEIALKPTVLTILAALMGLYLRSGDLDKKILAVVSILLLGGQFLFYCWIAHLKRRTAADRNSAQGMRTN